MNLFILKNKEIVNLSILILLFIIIRSLHFSYHLNFSMDQGLFSLMALELFQNKEISLIGPPTSYIFDGREIYQGGAIYYVFLFFLLLGNFDPIPSSYFFMLFASLMLIPLYFGMAYFTSKKAAWMVCILYAFLPYSIDYTRFLWNPNFQYVFSPVLILLMGLYKKTQRSYWLFCVALFSGFLLQFHYQFILIIFALFVYYFIVQKVHLRYLGIFIVGLVVGVSPLIIFELRNNFYNLQTLWLFITHGVLFVNRGGSFPLHYFLSILLFIYLFFGWSIQKFLSPKIVISFGITLFLISFFLYSQKPSHAFGMMGGWNYLQEEKVHDIIMKNNITNYNVTTLIYDMKAAVQKYLLIKDNVSLDKDNYTTNKYLYVISTPDYEYLNDPAHEIQSIHPAKQVQEWYIDKNFRLYLLKRIEKN